MKIFTAIILFSFLLTFSVKAQEIPAIKVTSLEGEVFETGLFNQSDNILKVLSFWATWCKPCINELTTLNDLSDAWKKELKYDFYAISQDDSRTSKKVASLVNGKEWEFNVLLDKNQDLKRLLNLPSIPYTIVVKNGKIIYRHVGYVEGDENFLFKIIKDNQ